MSAELYGDVDMTQVMFGRNARRVPAWLYVQDQGPGAVSFVGASKVEAGDNPLTYGGGHWDGGRAVDGVYFPHYLVVGEVIVRPHIVWGTKELESHGIGSLALGPHDEALHDGRLIVGSPEKLAALRDVWRRRW